MNLFEQLKQHSTLVIDTSEFFQISAFAAQDATTNPSLILKTAQQASYQDIVKAVLHDHAHKSPEEIVDYLLVAFGLEILKIIPGRVSTEVDAHLSFDVLATVKKAQSLIDIYQRAGVSRDRVLIKIAATWEGMQAAQILEQQGIHCNLTLIFAIEQAMAAFAIGASLISPFVGRIYDWHRQHSGMDYAANKDPGVRSVKQIYHYAKQNYYATEIMAASFRNIGQITALAGCDLLTISPALLAQLQQDAHTLLPEKLPLQAELDFKINQENLTESEFRYRLNANAMASEKLAEGIRLFCSDGGHLLEYLKQLNEF